MTRTLLVALVSMGPPRVDPASAEPPSTQHEPEPEPEPEREPDRDPQPEPDPDPDPNSEPEPQPEPTEPPPDPTTTLAPEVVDNPRVSIPEARLDNTAPPRVLTSLGIAGAVTGGYGLVGAGVGLGLALQQGNPDLQPIGVGVAIGGGAVAAIGLGMLIGDLARFGRAKKGPRPAAFIVPSFERPGAAIRLHF